MKLKPVWSSRRFVTSIDFLPVNTWAAPSDFDTYRLCEQRRFRRACASAQSRQNLRCSLIQAVSQEEPSDRKPDPWPFSMAGHARLKFVMTECSKTQIRLARPTYFVRFVFCSLAKRFNHFNYSRFDLVDVNMGPVKRICVFEHSVMTNFNCACPAIQRGQGSGFLSEGSS